jgi:hypothetical protein
LYDNSRLHHPYFAASDERIYWARSFKPMNDIREYRVTFSERPFRLFGCIGCLVTLFVIGGIVGLLWQGWRSLLGL